GGCSWAWPGWGASGPPRPSVSGDQPRCPRRNRRPRGIDEAAAAPESSRMNAIRAGLLSFLGSVVGAMAGLRLSKTLPPHHLDSDSKDVVRISMATVATLSALVL